MHRIYYVRTCWQFKIKLTGTRCILVATGTCFNNHCKQHNARQLDNTARKGRQSTWSTDNNKPSYDVPIACVCGGITIQ